MGYQVIVVTLIFKKFSAIYILNLLSLILSSLIRAFILSHFIFFNSVSGFSVWSCVKSCLSPITTCHYNLLTILVSTILLLCPWETHFQVGRGQPPQLSLIPTLQSSHQYNFLRAT